MKGSTILAGVLSAALALISGSAPAKVGTLDNVPAATLLLPYFEVDTVAANGTRTVFTIGNRAATEQLAHVTLWTDRGVPTLRFDVRLPPSGVKEIDLLALFTAGTVPSSTAGGFASCAATLPPANLNATDLTGLRNAHTGLASSLLSNQCGGVARGDGIARGYITVDVVRACSTAVPGDPGYFVFGGSGTATNDNVLWGEYSIANPAQNTAWGDTVVHIEASATDPTTDGVPNLPFGGAPATVPDYTFYGRRIGVGAADNREALPQEWFAAYAFDGPFTSTRGVVWRDPGVVTPFACASPPAGLGTRAIDIFNNQERVTTARNVLPLVPYATQTVDLRADPINVPYDNGMLHYNLGLLTASAPYDTRNQAYVSHRYTSVFGASGESKANTGILRILQGGTNYGVTFPQCSDGADNDGDGLVDFPADTGCRSATQGTEATACSNGVDDDSDTLIDFPNDPQCYAPRDLFEDANPACDDGIDNDLDGLTDWPADPRCSSPGQNTESEGICGNGIDDDGDGFTDFPADTGCSSRFGSTEAPVCRDGLDNDSDGFTDFPADTGCQTPFAITEAPICRDGLDNDSDGLIDFPTDPGCETAFSNTEAAVCNDGLDNDGDGLIDFPADPGCASASSNNERPQCNDTLDNDGNGLIDFPADALGCTSASDSFERTQQCADGLDNNGDGRIDYPNDPSCASPDETLEIADCSDTVDNDFDGLTDNGSDPGCASPLDLNELLGTTTRQCSDGVDNDGDGLMDFPSDNGCQSAWDDVEFSTSGNPVIDITPVTLVTAFLGAPYPVTLSGTGGTAPYSFMIGSGSLPAGLTLSTAGAFVGAPTATGTFNFIVNVTDNKGFSGSRPYALTVVDPNADLQLTLSASTTAALVNVPVTFTAASLNLGPSAASNVIISITLAPDFRFSSVNAAGANCTTPQIGTSGTVTCTYAGDTPAGASRAASVVAYSNVVGSHTVTATASSSTIDPVTANNSASVSVAITDLIEKVSTLSSTGLIVLALLMGLLGLAVTRRVD